jgi:hypothetical protein
MKAWSRALTHAAAAETKWELPRFLNMYRERNWGPRGDSRLHVAPVWLTSKAFLCVLLIAALQACATNRDSASVAPERDVSSLKALLVVTSSEDERGTDRSIASALNALGFQASTGPDKTTRSQIDAVVTYRARWNWDLTPYLIELTIYIREPEGDALIAVGNSFHTSLTRKSAEEMATEILTNMLKASKNRS